MKRSTNSRVILGSLALLFVQDLRPALAFAHSDASISLQESISQALSVRRSPEAFRRLEEQATQDRLRRWIPNSPQFQVTNSDNQTWQTYGVNFNLGFPGRPLLFSKLDRSKKEAAIADSYARRHEVVKEVVSFYVDCVQSSSLFILYQDYKTDLEALSQTLSALYSTGHVTQTEMIAAQLQARQSQNEAFGMKNRTMVACRKLSEYLGKEDVHPEPLPDDIDPSFLRTVQIRDPAELERAKAKREVAGAQSGAPSLDPLLPQFQVGAYRNRYLLPLGSPLGNDTLSSWTYSVSMSFPLFFAVHERADSKRQQAAALIESGEAEVEELTIRNEIQGSALEFGRVKDRLKVLRSQDLDLADAMVESTLSNYRHGKIGFAELLLARKMRIELRSEELQLQSLLLKLRTTCLFYCSEKEGTHS